MKISKHLFIAGLIALLGLLPSKEVKACDVCALFSGATPNILKNRAGLFFRYRSFGGLYDGTSYQKTSHFPGGLPIPTPENPVNIRGALRFFHILWQVVLPSSLECSASTPPDLQFRYGR